MIQIQHLIWLSHSQSATLKNLESQIDYQRLLRGTAKSHTILVRCTEQTEGETTLDCGPGLHS